MAGTAARLTGFFAVRDFEARDLVVPDLVVFFVVLRRVCASDDTATRDARANTLRKRSFLYSMILNEFC